MNHQMLELAPVTERAWTALREEIAEVLGIGMSARRVVAVDGPLGRDVAALSTGRLGAPIDVGHGGVGRIRQTQPLLEVEVPFEVPRTTLDALDRGVEDADVDSVRDAARRLAAIEDGAVYDGSPEAAIRGLRADTVHEIRELPADAVSVPRAIAKALSTLEREVIPGPYVAVVGATLHAELVSTFDEAGHTLLRHLQRLLGEDGRVERAARLDGALVLGHGGHVGTLSIGRDALIAYESHDEDSVRLRLEESLTFRIHADDAIVALVPNA